MKEHGDNPKFELIVENRGNSNDDSAIILLPQDAGIEPSKNYIFVDVRNNQKYEYTGVQLYNQEYQRHEFPVQLNSRWNADKPHTHHFVVFEG